MGGPVWDTDGDNKPTLKLTQPITEENVNNLFVACDMKRVNLNDDYGDDEDDDDDDDDKDDEDDTVHVVSMTCDPAL